METMPSLDSVVLALPYLFISGFLIMGLSKIFWLEAIYLISITKATAMAALVPLLTIFFAFLFLDEVPTFVQILGTIPIVLGGFLITRPVKREEEHIL